jgi:DNA-binding MurR/RpiR family transcriptional regulator
MSTNMAKHGKELSYDAKKIIEELIESGHQASHMAESSQISKSTISRFFETIANLWGHADLTSKRQKKK